jgi:hypothetical protein
MFCARRAGKYFGAAAAIACVRRSLTERSRPANSIVPPMRSELPIGVTATCASLRIEHRRGSCGGLGSVKE